MTATLPLAPKEYATDQEVRWCPGCGDYAVLKAVQKALSDLGARREQTVFVSGIGCSSRFPYYMSTYGFHTIHGRAPAVATGVKLANPSLDSRRPRASMIPPGRIGYLLRQVTHWSAPATSAMASEQWLQ